MTAGSRRQATSKRSPGCSEAARRRPHRSRAMRSLQPACGSAGSAQARVLEGLKRHSPHYENVAKGTPASSARVNRDARRSGSAPASLLYLASDVRDRQAPVALPCRGDGGQAGLLGRLSSAGVQFSWACPVPLASRDRNRVAGLKVPRPPGSVNEAQMSRNRAEPTVMRTAQPPHRPSDKGRTVGSDPAAPSRPVAMLEESEPKTL